MSSSTAYSERFSASLHKEQAQRQYGDRCGRSRPPSRSDGGDPAASSYGERAETQCKPLKNALGRNIVIVGAQWGDEGNGKVVDWLTARARGVVRFQGGHTPRHAFWIDRRKTFLRPIPSAIMHPQVKCSLGNGVVLSPEALF